MVHGTEVTGAHESVRVESTCGRLRIVQVLDELLIPARTDLPYLADSDGGPGVGIDDLAIQVGG